MAGVKPLEVALGAISLGDAADTGGGGCSGTLTETSGAAGLTSAVSEPVCCSCLSATGSGCSMLGAVAAAGFWQACLSAQGLAGLTAAPADEGDFATAGMPTPSLTSTSSASSPCTYAPGTWLEYYAFD